MSTGRDIGDGAPGASPLLARAAAAATHAGRRLTQGIGDLFLSDDARLSERERVLAAATLAAMARVVESDLQRQMARVLGKGPDAAATLDALISGAPADVELAAEVLARVRLELLADALPTTAPDEPDGPALLPRLAASGDARVAKATLALMTTASRRRSFSDSYRLAATELPAELHHALVWRVAAALRRQFGQADADRALTDAALRNLGLHDEGDRVEAAAMKLATAIDARPDEVPVLLTHAIADRQVALFAALLAVALRTDFAAAREMVIERDAALWLALRAIELDRPTIARLGLALARDTERFAGELDMIMAVDPDAARMAIARSLLHPDFRAALGRIEAAR